MKIFKFTIGWEYRVLKTDPRRSYKACAAVALAEDEAAARAQLKATGIDMDWLEVADVTVLPVEAANVVAVIMY